MNLEERQQIELIQTALSKARENVQHAINLIVNSTGVGIFTDTDTMTKHITELDFTISHLITVEDHYRKLYKL